MIVSIRIWIFIFGVYSSVDCATIEVIVPVTGLLLTIVLYLEIEPRFITLIIALDRNLL